MRNEQVEAVQGEMLHRDSDEPLVASELNEAATTAALPRELRQDASAAACDEPCALIIAGRLPRRSTLSCHTVPRRAASC